MTFKEWELNEGFLMPLSDEERDIARSAWNSATEAAKLIWIPVTERFPDTIEGENYSKNVYVVSDGAIGVMAICYHEDGYLWGNCYGDIFGDPQEDDDYKVSHWCGINIPELINTKK